MPELLKGARFANILLPRGRGVLCTSILDEPFVLGVLVFGVSTFRFLRGDLLDDCVLRGFLVSLMLSLLKGARFENILPRGVGVFCASFLDPDELLVVLVIGVSILGEPCVLFVSIDEEFPILCLFVCFVPL